MIARKSEKKTADAADPFEKLPVHEAADWFPLLEGPAFDDLVENIRRFGLREPIVMTADGKLLDGRNRYRACLAAGVEPEFRTFRGPGKAFQYVISANLHRRHLTTSQRAMIAAKIATLDQGARTDLAENSAMSQPEAAKLLHVSRGSVQNAKTVIDRGTEELAQAVHDGALTVGAAVDAIALSPDDQRDVVRQVKRGVKASVAIPKKKSPAKPKRPKQAPPASPREGQRRRRADVRAPTARRTPARRREFLRHDRRADHPHATSP